MHRRRRDYDSMLWKRISLLAQRASQEASLRTLAGSLLALLLLAVAFVAALGGFPTETDLDESLTTDQGHFKIYWTNQTSSEHVANHEIIDPYLADNLEAVLDTFVNLLGYKDPVTAPPLAVEVLNIASSGYAIRGSGGGQGYIQLDSDGFNKPLADYLSNTGPQRQLVAHEMFHLVQNEYAARDVRSSFFREGTARMIQDKLFVDVDEQDTSYYWTVNRYLSSYTHHSLLDLSYTSCLFWNYLTEQFGEMTTEPYIGLDFVGELLDGSGCTTCADDIQHVDATLLPEGESFESAFLDFVIANYTKDFTDASHPAKWKYIDDDGLPGSYASVGIDASLALAVDDAYTATDWVQSWGARYYEIAVDPGVTSVEVTVDQLAESNGTLACHLLAIKSDAATGAESVDTAASVLNGKGGDFEATVLNSGFDRLVLIVTSVDHRASYRYSISTGGDDPTLRILSPTSSNVAWIGQTLLNPFQVHIEIIGPEGTSLGLEPEDFTVTVSSGGTTDTLTVVTGLQVLGHFWLVVDPVTRPLGYHDLEVTVTVDGILLDATSSNSVYYDTSVAEVDSVIVIDRSGSMLEPDWEGSGYEQPDPTDKIYGAINAAKLYVDIFKEDDQVGLVWFSNDAEVAAQLGKHDGNREDLKGAIDDLALDDDKAWRKTSIGDGLHKAQEELDTRAIAGHERAIIVLSDGKANEDREIDDVVCDGCKIDTDPDPGDPETTIHAIALGDDADCVNLEAIAKDTGGLFEWVPDPASGDLPNDLADVYLAFAEKELGLQRIAAIRGSYGDDNPAPTHTIEVEANVVEAVFVINHVWLGHAPHNSLQTAILRTPAGTDVTPTYVDDTHHVFRVDAPVAGTWTVILVPLPKPPLVIDVCVGDFCPDPEEGVYPGTYLVEASIRCKPSMWTPTPELRTTVVVGTPIPLLAVLADHAPILDAVVRAEITIPKSDHCSTGCLPREIVTVMLRDDGVHGDGRADDGVYGYLFRATSRPGVYSVRIIAEGTSEHSGAIRREAKFAFNIEAGRDLDCDRLPTHWETLYGLDPEEFRFGQGMNGDPDLDGLSNLLEFEYGLDPLDPDTDGSGEIDGSEIAAGRDPATTRT